MAARLVRPALAAARVLPRLVLLLLLLLLLVHLPAWGGSAFSCVLTTSGGGRVGVPAGERSAAWGRPLTAGPRGHAASADDESDREGADTAGEPGREERYTRMDSWKLRWLALRAAGLQGRCGGRGVTAPGPPPLVRAAAAVMMAACTGEAVVETEVEARVEGEGEQRDDDGDGDGDDAPGRRPVGGTVGVGLRAVSAKNRARSRRAQGPRYDGNRCCSSRW